MVVVAAAGVAMDNRMSSVADAQLVGLVREGHEDAFKALYDRHRRAVLRHCRRLLQSSSDAEDALQQTFTAAYADIVASEKSITPLPWLLTIARNHCLTVLRQRREHPVAELPTMIVDGPHERVQRRIQLAELLTDLDRLPDAQRDALVLQELTALSTEQIGSTLHVPAAKIKALVFQARAALEASRRAREMDCGDVRAQLASATGGELRRGHLRRHLQDCPDCRAFRRHRRG